MENSYSEVSFVSQYCFCKLKILCENVLTSVFFKIFFRNFIIIAVAVGESAISLKGRVSFKTYNTLKPIEFGLKRLLLSYSGSCCVYDFKPYSG
jgi:hypothetical protein